MYDVTIDPELCKKDGLCAMTCPVAVIQQDEKVTVPKIPDEHMERCIACGHCVAICRHGAISHSQTRRSIRAFRDKSLAKDTIETIIDGARFAPSGHNSQSTEFLVVQDRAVLNEVTATVIEYLKFEIKRFSNPLFRTMALLADRDSAESGLHEIPGFKRKIHMFESGADPILNGAPVLLVFHAQRTIGFADVNAQLALQNASLVAHALGIGHFYTGWVLSPCRAPMARTWNRRIPSLLGIPPDNNLYGALALGYPIPRFKNMIERKPPVIRWA